MAPIMLIQEDEQMISQLEHSQAAVKSFEQQASVLKAVGEFDDDGDTTDVGCGSASETEDSSGLSGTESSHGGASGVGRRCRFGTTALETIPATPVGTMRQAPVSSPPGLSRAAMRQARDACKRDTLQGVSDSKTEFSAIEDGLASSKPCRFDSTPLGTVPATPPTAAKWKPLAKLVGSPPGLSRASMRQARDACKVGGPTPSSWGAAPMALTISPGGAPMTPPAVRSAKRRAAREALLLRAKQGAALLKAEAHMNCLSADAKEFVPSTLLNADIGSFTLTPNSSEHERAVPNSNDDVAVADQVTGVVQCSASEESSSESSVAESHRCRFGGTALETVPATPVGVAGVASLASPPGLSRAAMRQARDACTSAAAAVATSSWGGCHASTQSAATLAVTPCGKPMTPPALLSAKRRAARDALLAHARQEGPTTWCGQMSHTMSSAVPR